MDRYVKITHSFLAVFTFLILTTSAHAIDLKPVQPAKPVQPIQPVKPIPQPVQTMHQIKPATGMQPPVRSAPAHLIPLSQVDLSHLKVQFASDAPDSTFIAEIQRQAERTGWQEATLVLHLAIQSMEQHNEDKKYFQRKLAHMNEIGEIGEALPDLWGGDLNDQITGGAHNHEESSKKLANHQIVYQEAQHKYMRCVETTQVQRTFLNMDCLYPAWDVTRSSPLSISFTRVFESLDRLEAGLSKLDFKSLAPGDREFYERVKDVSRRFRKIVERQGRLMERFPFNRLPLVPLQTTPVTNRKQLPVVRTAPVVEMKESPVAPEPAQPAKPVTPTIPLVPDMKNTK